MQNSNMKFRLIVLSFLQFAIWGAYLTSMGRYLGGFGLGANIGWFYSVQGIVSIFMPAIMGVVADRWVPAQRLLAFCHAMASLFMAITGYIGLVKGGDVAFGDIFWTYTVSVAFTCLLSLCLIRCHILHLVRRGLIPSRLSLQSGFLEL